MIMYVLWTKCITCIKNDQHYHKIMHYCAAVLCIASVHCTKIGCNRQNCRYAVTGKGLPTALPIFHMHALHITSITAKAQE